MDEIRFTKVWYRPEHKPYAMLLAFSDVGTLTLNKGSLKFKGRGIELTYHTIDEVLYDGAEGDWINYWVYVRSGDNIACFADGGWLGFRGHIANGTKKIFETILNQKNNSGQQAASSNP